MLKYGHAIYSLRVIELIDVILTNILNRQINDIILWSPLISLLNTLLLFILFYIENHLTGCAERSKCTMINNHYTKKIKK